ncbi:hypothetical protein [Novosphingobium sp. BW1]|uniref:hypothetical protein n=1 Tax=Novosphingobium sp. BW1 TaxID=2592621 RepID=UPI0011DEE0B5|nr:hypothetical protein [Novosphingobium sp. BW1]TYC83757.1 hypothetical protein FMM79_18945 [Novosphingobium sp. BW1]
MRGTETGSAMTQPSRFKQSDITRAIKAAEAAGMHVGRIEIDPNGRIILHAVSAPGTVMFQRENSWDDLLR